MALRGFRPGCQRGALAQGCLRALRTTERFNHDTVGGWERVCEGDIQQPAADTGAASTVTFCLRDLSASVAEKVKSQPQTRPGDEEGVVGLGVGGETYSNLDFISVELGLDGSESSQLPKLENTDKPNSTWKQRHTKHIRVCLEHGCS